MNNPTDASIAQANDGTLPELSEGLCEHLDVYFRAFGKLQCDNLLAAIESHARLAVYKDRAREMDAEKGGEADGLALCAEHGATWVRGCDACNADLEALAEMDPYPPPAQAAEAVERVADAIREHYTSPMWPDWHAAARAAIAAMQAGEETK